MLLATLLVVATIAQANDREVLEEPWYLKVAGEGGQVTLPLGQKELGLSPDQIEKIKGIAESLDASQNAERKKLNVEGQIFAQMEPAAKKRIIDLQDNKQLALDALVLNVLTTDQYIRYKQISIQRRGTMAFVRKDITAYLNLTDEQKARTSEINKKTVSEAREMEREYLAKHDRTQLRAAGGSKEIHSKHALIVNKGVAECLKVLDDHQREQWKIMTGPVVSEPAVE